MAEAYYSLAGPVLKVASESAELLNRFDRPLRALRLAAAAPQTFRLSLRHGAPGEIPPTAKIYYSGEVAGEGTCIFGEDEAGRYFLMPDRVSFVLDASGDAGCLTVQNGEEARLNGTAFFHALDAALVAGGQTLIHAAAATLPDRRSAILIFAPSGTGKTTVSLALLHAGYGVYSDDTAVIRRDDGQHQVWGVPRAFKVHRQTARLFPWLGEHLTDSWDAHGEQLLSMDSAGKLGRIEAAQPREVAAVIRLNERSAGEHVLRRLPKNEALVSLSADNLRTGAGGMPQFMQSRFGVLTALIQEAATFELTTGDDMERLGAFVLDRIGAQPFALAGRHTGRRMS
jgi:hypothetical protein